MHDTRTVVTDFARRVTESRLPVTTFGLRVTTFRLPQNGAFASHLSALKRNLQCTQVGTTNLMLRVTEVTNFLSDREVRHETSKIIAIIFDFYVFRNFSLSRRKLVTSVTVQVS